MRTFLQYGKRRGFHLPLTHHSLDSRLLTSGMTEGTSGMTEGWIPDSSRLFLMFLSGITG